MKRKSLKSDNSHLKWERERNVFQLLRIKKNWKKIGTHMYITLYTCCRKKPQFTFFLFVSWMRALRTLKYSTFVLRIWCTFTLRQLNYITNNFVFTPILYWSQTWLNVLMWRKTSYKFFWQNHEFFIIYV